MTEPVVDALAADLTVKAGEPVASEADRIKELQDKLDKANQILEKNKSENVALGEARKKVEELQAQLDAAKNPPTMAAAPQGQAITEYWIGVIAAAQKGEGWALDAIEARRREEGLQWQIALNSVPEAIRDEVKQVAEQRRVSVDTAREFVEARKRAEHAEKLELRKDKEARERGAQAANVSGSARVVSPTEIEGAMTLSSWKQATNAARDRLAASGGTDEAAKKEILRLASLRDAGKLILDK
jgi:hypothetical protein